MLQRDDLAREANHRLDENAYRELATVEVAAAVNNSGHFDKIMDTIDEMITALRGEEAEDICPQ